MKTLRKVIEIDEDLCNGCGQCVPSCAEGAIQIIDGKARLVADKLCDGLGACLGECPLGALRVIEREADGFDEEAVKAHLGHAAPAPVAAPAPAAMHSGCPGQRAMSFQPAAQAAPSAEAPAASALSQWPVQIRLIGPNAPYLKNADLLVAADCVPFAYARFHQDLLAGKRVLVGCPKLDDGQEIVDKFAAIFAANDIASVTVAVMEVPCCQRLPMMIRQALVLARKDQTIQCVTVSLRGDILDRSRA